MTFPTRMVLAMDPFRRLRRCRAHDYSQLTDQELRSAIEFVENRACCLTEDREALHQLYSTEASIMRRQLVERALARLFAHDALLTADQARTLGDIVLDRHIDVPRLTWLVRSATNGRTADVGELTRMEATALLLQLRRES